MDCLCLAWAGVERGEEVDCGCVAGEVDCSCADRQCQGAGWGCWGDCEVCCCLGLGWVELDVRVYLVGSGLGEWDVEGEVEGAVGHCCEADELVIEGHVDRHRESDWYAGDGESGSMDSHLRAYRPARWAGD